MTYEELQEAYEREEASARIRKENEEWLVIAAYQSTSDAIRVIDSLKADREFLLEKLKDMSVQS